MCLHLHQHEYQQESSESESNLPPPSIWRTPFGWGLLLLIGAAIFVLLTEHLVHLSALFPYLFLFFCLIMHVFMHRGHRHHKHHFHHRPPDESASVKKDVEESDHAS